MGVEEPTEDLYEYRVIQPREDLEDTLNDLGEDGWRFVDTVMQGQQERLVLRRKDLEREVRIDNEDV